MNRSTTRAPPTRKRTTNPLPAAGRGRLPSTPTALWLRAAFADLSWQINSVVAEGDLIVVHATMSGRHTGPFVTYDLAGAVESAMPPTGKQFSVAQTHWFRVADGQVIDHWANRDDLAMARQLGWVPPSPLFLLRMALAKRRARRASV
ncbi:ester cyclase [Streptomyces sp. WM6378]|uniref:ester cyclase n=1 Tax=Streptomyces sp. WM6378 TaxID=1415557 RepID=UPI000AF487C5|nr:ester cyclase [Streptomyces sp. WM6378]